MHRFPRPTWYLFPVFVSILVIKSSADCPSAWRPSDGLPGLNGAAHAVVSWDPDGAGPTPPLLVVGGTFSVAGAITAANVVTWDGAHWHPLGSGTNGEIDATTTYNGDLIAGGLFSSAGGAPANNIARWNGMTWQPLGGGMNGRVWALAVYNGELIVGGLFTTAGGAAANRIARWNGTSWQTMGTGMNNTVYSITVYNGDLIAGGLFTTAGGVSAARIARWNGASWQPLGIGISGCSPQPCLPNINAMTVFNGELVAGGNFTAAGGMSVNHIVSWNGTSWQQMGTGMDNIVNALTVHNGELIVGGGFTSPGGPPGISRWNGLDWISLSAWTEGTMYALYSFEGELVAGGSFDIVGGVGNDNVTRWNGSEWYGFGGGFGGDSPIVRTNFAVYQGELIAAGSFIGASGVGVRFMAAWNGTSWHPLGEGVSSYVYAQTVYNGELVVGVYDYITLARWDGATWHPLEGVTHVPPYAALVLALIPYENQLIVVGMFDTAGSTPANSIASWDGSAWHSFGTGLTYDATHLAYVYSVVAYNGKLVVGGRFTYAGGASANYIAQWDGSTWQPLGAGMNDRVLAMTVFQGDLFAAGDFTSAGGVSVGRIARWNGSAWSDVGASGGMDGRVLTLAVYDDELIAAGYFTAADGQPADRIAGWNGLVWRPLPGSISGGLPNVSSQYVAALGEYNGELIIGGNFTLVDGNPNAYWARWGPDCRRGDMDCNKSVDLEDIPGFIAALLDPEAQSYCARYFANVSGDVLPDGTPRVDGADIPAFVNAVLGG